MRRFMKKHVSAALVAAVAAFASPLTAQVTETATVGGIALGVEIESLEAPGVLTSGDVVSLRVSLRDTAGSTPLGGAEPAAWMGPRPSGSAPACGERVAAYLSGDLFSRAAVDFNVYYLLTLNHDATLSVVDPLFGFGGSRVLALVVLESRGVDWALFEDAPTMPGRLFVSQPEAGRVAVVATDAWRIEHQVDVAPGVGRLARQDDGAFLWALYPDGLAVIDARTGRLASRVAFESGADAVDFVLDEDDRHAWVLLRGGEVLVVDARRREVLGRLATGRLPSSIAWSSLAREAWVGHGDGSLVTVDLDPEGRPRFRGRIDTGTPLGQIRFAPGGRLGFAVSPDSNLLHVLDAARGRLIQSGPMAGGPDQVAFSSELAYVRHRDSEQVLMVPLGTVPLDGAEGEPIRAADFPGGNRPFGRGPEDGPPVLASSFDRAPGANAMVLANPGDEAVYFYMEGMAAPMGHFTTPGRRPLAVRVVDRSLRERGPGIYETFARLEGPGTYDVAVFLDAPRLIHCFAVEVEPEPAAEAGPPVLRLAENGARALPGGGVALELEAARPGSGAPVEGLGDLVLLVNHVAGAWHRRVRAEPVPAGAPGRYRARLFPAVPGEYLLFAESASAGLRGRLPLLRLQVPAAAAGGYGSNGPTEE